VSARAAPNAAKTEPNASSQTGVLPDGCGEVDVITMPSKHQEYTRDE
jgi:hypothetical protein